MIKTITAYTEEIDDLELAASEIKEGLDYEGNALKNTVGICACNYEFVLSGAAKAICESLPFDVVGSITTAQAVNGKTGALIFSIMMLTSDDVRFAPVLSDSLRGGYSESLRAAYQSAASSLKKSPDLVFAMAPFMVENSGDDYVDILTEVSGGAPVFGTLAVDDTPDFRECYSIFNGEHYHDRMAMILVEGNVTPRFYIATISGEKVLNKSALITCSDGHILKSVNEKPLMDYFNSVGLGEASETSYAMTSLPFMVDYNDGTPPVSKVFIGFDDNGYGICAGRMPEGSTLYIGVFDKDDVLKTTTGAVAKAMGEADGNNMLIYSCVSRNMSLSGDVLAELDAVKETIGGKLQFMMAYSGGEICPTRISEQLATNRFHNNSFILCTF